MALEMRPECERCGAMLAPDGEATICSYECTFCADCSQALDATCPYCAGFLAVGPTRAASGREPSGDLLMGATPVQQHRQALKELEARVVSCRRCPRLVAWREQVAREKRAAFADEEYWGRP